MLSSTMLCIFCTLSFFNLLQKKNAREDMEDGIYFYAFIGNVLAFVEGCLFAYFTYDLLSDHMTSIDDN